MKKPKLTRWFNIAKDGQPTRAGWYEVLYNCSKEELEEPSDKYWDGSEWRYAPSQETSMFGNYEEDFKREQWRGLTSKATA